MCEFTGLFVYSTIITNIFVCAGIVFAFIQLTIVNKQKKRETIEYYGKIRKERQDSLIYIEKWVEEHGTISEESIKKDITLKEAVLTYLSHTDRIAIGIQEKVYDFDVFYGIVGADEIDAFLRIEKAIPYFTHRKSDDYKAIKQLMKRIEEKNTLKG